ncbi:hypothetical protein [Bradyrhizobium betae]|uniref:Uncharacterized protein n=1 Tax=Bradyrhizobium betae TaxID=244734 RepID=A0A5P6PFB7_9BRAD|nr:hypothetical protein [Bradyrhizobium betae]MCS3729734.1 hypothetical protein [Bradyrhizobium betae]QFI76043.1 hypothetical protein F8237_28775 [Bradyrhizobium betae]
MRIREENRNIFLLATVTLCCGVVAGTATLLEPVFGQAPAKVSEKQVADGGRGDVAAQPPVRVVGGPVFVPNVNPRQR